jgi:putative membrane protein
MKKGLKLPTIFVYLLLAGLLAYFIPMGNYEFIGYAVVVGLLYYAVLAADKYYNFPVYSFWLFGIWVVSHMLGGALYFGGTRLYDTILIPIFNGGGEFVILKYDQLIHAYCYIAFAVLVYHALKKHFKKGQDRALILFTILAAVGIGLLNEVIEFGMVVFADAADAVGGYYNTALDLVFNLIGAIIGAILAWRLDSFSR